MADHPYILLIIKGSASGKTISLFNPISHQSDTNKICLYAKHPYEAKYKLIINKKQVQDQSI